MTTLNTLLLEEPEIKFVGVWDTRMDQPREPIEAPPGEPEADPGAAEEPSAPEAAGPTAVTQTQTTPTRDTGIDE